MTAKEIYKKHFNDAESISRQQAIDLINHFGKALELERNKVKNCSIPDVISYSYCDCNKECKNLDCSVIKCKQGNKR